MRKVIDLQSVEELNNDAMHDSSASYLACGGAPSNGSAMFC